MELRKSLSEILHGSQKNALEKAFNETEAAEEFGPIPPGNYITRILSGELHEAKTGTASYRLTFKIVEGQFAERRLWHDLWLTEAAVPQTKRDLGKLGIHALDQLEQPFPQGIRCEVKAVIRSDDKGGEFNRVKSFKVIGIDAPDDDPFAPVDASPNNPNGSDGAEAEVEEPIRSDLSEGEQGDLSFDFGNNLKPKGAEVYYANEV